MKEALLKRPVFLTKNAHVLKQKYSYNNNIQVKFFDDIKQRMKKSSQKVQDKYSDKEYFKSDPLDNTSKCIRESENKIKYDPNNTILMYRRNSLKNSRKVRSFLLVYLKKKLSFIYLLPKNLANRFFKLPLKNLFVLIHTLIIYESKISVLFYDSYCDL